MFRWGIKLLLVAAIVLAPSTVAFAVDLSHSAFAQSGKITSIPVGHMEFCRSRPAECGRNSEVVQAVSLDQAAWDELIRVNYKYNTEVRPVTDDDLYRVAEFWTYPSGAGDCEDYVLAKRRALIDAGWPASTLLITVVRQADGAGHAVLIARTDRGDLVLDNQASKVLRWSETPYEYVKRQSQADAGTWVELFDNRLNNPDGISTAAVGSTNQ